MTPTLKTSQNNDKTIYTVPPKDWKDKGYTPKLFITQEEALGINVGGYVKVKPIEEWFNNPSPLASLDEEEVAKELSIYPFYSGRFDDMTGIEFKEFWLKVAKAICDLLKQKGCKIS